MQIARQLLARLLLCFGQILLLLLQIKIQLGVLQRDQRLLGDRLEQLDAFRREEGGIRMRKQQQAVRFQLDDQRHAHTRLALVQSGETLQFRVTRRILEFHQVTRRQRALSGSALAAQPDAQVCRGQPARGLDLQVLSSDQQKHADQPLVLRIPVADG